MRILVCYIALHLACLMSVSGEVKFTSPSEIEEETLFPVVLGIILINIKRQQNKTWELFQDKLVPMMDSLLSRSYETNLHFIIITDAWTLNGMCMLALQYPADKQNILY